MAEGNLNEYFSKICLTPPKGKMFEFFDIGAIPFGSTPSALKVWKDSVAVAFRGFCLNVDRKNFKQKVADLMNALSDLGSFSFHGKKAHFEKKVEELDKFLSEALENADN